MSFETDYDLAADIAAKNAAESMRTHAEEKKRGQELVKLALKEGKISSFEFGEIDGYGYYPTIAVCCKTTDDVKEWIDSILRDCE